MDQGVVEPGHRAEPAAFPARVAKIVKELSQAGGGHLGVVLGFAVVARPTESGVHGRGVDPVWEESQ
ncbi:cobb/cobq domain-containing glutamine amidotransferase [Streptomyces malaysiensis]|uniref:Cobb/cobq domain-containing glutamine amidotransferase n=1 Tax=Streptomyces malaysiensis TaxID=92644 RepID=A0A7X5X6M3_STRMQ|nr:cobb/cobq domain-containing glutamine amidotransferase [Streptomyces malaysiensis]